MLCHRTYSTHVGSQIPVPLDSKGEGLFLLATSYEVSQDGSHVMVGDFLLTAIATGKPTIDRCIYIYCHLSTTVVDFNILRCSIIFITYQLFIIPLVAEKLKAH